MRTVHLGVVELKGDCQICLEPASVVASPDYKWVVEDAAIHSYGSVNIVLNQCRGAYHHIIRNVMVLAGFCNLSRQSQIIGIEF